MNEEFYVMSSVLHSHLKQLSQINCFVKTETTVRVGAGVEAVRTRVKAIHVYVLFLWNSTRTQYSGRWKGRGRESKKI